MRADMNNKYTEMVFMFPQVLRLHSLYFFSIYLPESFTAGILLRFECLCTEADLKIRWISFAYIL